MEAFLTSLGLVAIAEMGDKTQILALLLASRFRKPWAVVFGIFAASAGNHLMASFVGVEAADILSASWLRWGLAALFILTGLWTLVPDRFDEGDARHSSSGAFLTTLVAFFLVEMGDKTQLATVALAARFHSVVTVAAGTTLGMLVADVPAVFLGERLTRRIPGRFMRAAAALSFVASGVWILVAP